MQTDSGTGDPKVELKFSTKISGTLFHRSNSQFIRTAFRIKNGRSVFKNGDSINGNFSDWVQFWKFGEIVSPDLVASLAA